MDTHTLASSGTVVARAAPGHGEVLAALRPAAVCVFSEKSGVPKTHLY